MSSHSSVLEKKSQNNAFNLKSLSWSRHSIKMIIFLMNAVMPYIIIGIFLFIKENEVTFLVHAFIIAFALRYVS